jgi:hypothetical protein
MTVLRENAITEEAITVSKISLVEARKKKALDTALRYYRVATGSENPFKANEDIKIICLKRHDRRK